MRSEAGEREQRRSKAGEQRQAPEKIGAGKAETETESRRRSDPGEDTGRDREKIPDEIGRRSETSDPETETTSPDQPQSITPTSPRSYIWIDSGLNQLHQ